RARSLPLELVAELPVARDDEVRLRHEARRLDQRPMILLGREPRDVADQRALRAQRRAGAVEPVEVDPEGDDVARPTAVALPIYFRGVDHLRPCQPAEP